MEQKRVFLGPYSKKKKKKEQDKCLYENTERFVKLLNDKISSLMFNVNDLSN